MIYIYTPLYLDKEEEKNSKTLKLGYMVQWVGGDKEKSPSLSIRFHFCIRYSHVGKTKPAGGEEKRRRRTMRGGNSEGEKLRIRQLMTWQ